MQRDHGGGPYPTCPLEEDGDKARIRPQLGGLPDVDVTGFVPGFEDGVPRDLGTLVSKIPPGGDHSSDSDQPGDSGSSEGPSPVDLAGLKARASIRMGGSVAGGGFSAEVADREDQNRVDADVAGTGDAVIRFVGLLVGALRVDVPAGSGKVGQVAATGGKVELSGGGSTVTGTVGAIIIDDAEGRANP